MIECHKIAVCWACMYRINWFQPHTYGHGWNEILTYDIISKISWGWHISICSMKRCLMCYAWWFYFMYNEFINMRTLQEQYELNNASLHKLPLTQNCYITIIWLNSITAHTEVYDQQCKRYIKLIFSMIVHFRKKWPHMILILGLIFISQMFSIEQRYKRPIFSKYCTYGFKYLYLHHHYSSRHRNEIHIDRSMIPYADKNSKISSDTSSTKILHRVSRVS